MIFQVKHSTQRPYEYKNRVHWVASYEMNLNQKTVERQVYSGLDWIGDMGGLLDGLNVMFVIILTVINHKLFSRYLVTQLTEIDDRGEGR